MQQSGGINDLLTRFRSGDRLACSRIISLVENDEPEAAELLPALYPQTGKARRIGITGPPGAGKSTLVDKLTLSFRRLGLTVGIVSVDPTSPFTGGAILGDRVRMQEVFLDEGVFIRSMASRGSWGGLAGTTKEVCDVLDAFGKDLVLIETVGVGQSELDIANTADTVVVVLVPESGDGIQVMKAGLMEIADLFVVNKADREGADLAAMEIEAALEVRPATEDGWVPTVTKTVAFRGDGVEELRGQIERHGQFLEERGLKTTLRRARIAAEIRELVERRVRQRLWACQVRPERLECLVDQVCEGKETPYGAAAQILERAEC
jgi:LAO/AO transport system kinase